MDVYVINLDRQTARLRWMADGLRAAGVEFRRMPAVDGYRLSELCADRPIAGNAFPMSRFDIAVIMTHRKVWRALLRSASPHCAVLEDDIHIGRDFAALLAALDRGEVAFDMVKLEAVGERVMVDAGRPRRFAGRDLCPLRSTYLGAAGYILNRKAAAKLLDVTRSMAAPIDRFLFDERYLVSNGLAVLQTIPAVVAQEEHLRSLPNAGELRSSLPERGAAKKKKKQSPLMDKLAREASRPFRQLGAALIRKRRMMAEPGLRWGRIGFE